MSANPITLRLAYPVSANRYWRTYVLPGKAGAKARVVTHLSTEAQAYKRDVGRRAAIVGIRRPMSDWLALELTVHPPEPKDAAARARKLGPLWHLGVRCIDMGNAEKIAGDALQGIVFLNDAQIVDLRIRRGMPVPDGALVVRVALADVASINPESASALFDA